jgi:tetratricopeptide (TPR) repeat protein
LHTILADPRGKHLISRQTAASEQALAALLSNIRRAWATDESDHIRDLGIDAGPAHEALARGRSAAPNVLQLTAIAQRLEPTDFGRLYAANWLQLGAQHRSAIALLLNVVSLPSTPLMSAIVGTNLGLAYHHLGHYSESLAWYRRASEQLPSYSPGVVSRLVVAIELGVLEEALSASRLLDEFEQPDSPEMLWECQAASIRRPDFLAQLSPQGRQVLTQIRGTLGPTSRSMVNALK